MPRVIVRPTGRILGKERIAHDVHFLILGNGTRARLQVKFLFSLMGTAFTGQGNWHFDKGISLGIQMKASYFVFLGRRKVA
jgi:hypothetical protein